MRPHDPFELIRWLALSQPDPRKALAELVQNSLDAGARTVRVTRVRERGVPCLKIFDDGEGVIPTTERTEALKYIATHVGHSRKRSLSPQERLTLMTQGQYGIGLLGFWSLGERLEMRTAVPGQVPHRLVLHRDRPDYVIEPLRGRLTLDERWTEVVIVGLFTEAQAVLVARRAADYLGAELRGQLLAREVTLVVEDRMSRGRAPKELLVRPPRFLGERVEGLDRLEVPGYPPIRLEVYLAAESVDGDGPRPLAVYAAGTLVTEGFDDLAALGLDHAPWTDRRLTGLVDFPSLRVSPGSRRGVVADEASAAFVNALRRVEPVLSGVLEALERRRAEALDQTLIRDLQRTFRDFYRHRPRYAMLPVHRAADFGTVDGSESSKDAADSTGVAVAEPEVEAGAATRSRQFVPDLLPPGPLVAVRVTPSPVRVEVAGERRIRASGLDATGRVVDGVVSCSWRQVGEVGTLVVDEASTTTAVLHASSEPTTGTFEVTMRREGHEAATTVEVEVVEELGRGAAVEGIPEPELTDDPGATWRSRIVDERWQVNTGHRDYRSVADQPSLKLRYLAALFAKEIVLRSSQDPRLDRPLEQLVEIATYADLNLSGRRRNRRKKD